MMSMTNLLVGIPLPLSLKVEITTRCNLACRFCGRGMAVEILARHKGIDIDAKTRYIPKFAVGFGNDLKLKRFVSIVEGVPTLKEVDLQGVGEPLLHPEFLQILFYLAKKGIYVTFTTNGTLLSREIARAIVENRNVRQITVSLDAVQPDLYKFLRRGGNLTKVLNNLQYLINVRNNASEALPKVRIAVVLNKLNAPILEGIIDIAVKLGVDAVVISMLKDVDGRLGALLLPPDKARLRMQNIVLYAKSKGMVLEDETGLLSRLSNDSTHELCAWPWLSAMITVEGFVTPCGYATQANEFHLGSIDENVSFAEVWNGEKYAEFRLKMLQGETQGLPCHKCKDFVRTSRQDIFVHLKEKSHEHQQIA